MSTKPRVWCSFTAKHKNGDVKLRIQDLSNSHVEDCVNLFTKYFATQETFHKAAGVTGNAEALKESAGLIKEMIKMYNLVTCNIDDGSDAGGELIAGSVMCLRKRSDPPDTAEDFPTKTKEMTKFIELVLSVGKMHDPLKHFDLDSIYEGRGVVVHPDYRGLGIAEKLFHVRRIIIKEESVPMTGVLVTGIGSQKAAERDGWETIFEISFEELEKRLGVVFEGAPPTCKYMVARPL